MIVHTQVRPPHPRESSEPHRDSTHVSLTLQMEIVTRLLPDFAHVSVTVASRAGDLSTFAHLSQLARDLGAMQHVSGAGPSLDTMRTGTVVAAPHIGRDDRWAAYVPAAAALGLRSQLAAPLLVDGRPVGTLDLYSTTRDRIGRATPGIAEAVAAQVVESMRELREIEHLRCALDSRACIGQATGLVMERLQLDADRAFAYLRRVSMQQNRKLAQVAEEMVRTRQLPSRAEGRLSPPRAGEEA